MTTKLTRAAGVVFIIAGVLGAIGLIVLAQPEESYGDVNTLLVISGIASGFSGAAFGVLFLEVSRIGGKIDKLQRSISRMKTSSKSSDSSSRNSSSSSRSARPGRRKNAKSGRDGSSSTETSSEYRECKRNGGAPFRSGRDVCPHCRNPVGNDGMHPLRT